MSPRKSSKKSRKSRESPKKRKGKIRGHLQYAALFPVNLAMESPKSKWPSLPSLMAWRSRAHRHSKRTSFDGRELLPVRKLEFETKENIFLLFLRKVCLMGLFVTAFFNFRSPLESLAVNTAMRAPTGVLSTLAQHAGDRRRFLTTSGPAVELDPLAHWLYDEAGVVAAEKNGRETRDAALSVITGALRPLCARGRETSLARLNASDLAAVAKASGAGRAFRARGAAAEPLPLLKGLPLPTRPEMNEWTAADTARCSAAVLSTAASSAWRGDTAAATTPVVQWHRTPARLTRGAGLRGSQESRLAVVLPVATLDAALAAINAWPRQPMQCDGVAVVFSCAEPCAGGSDVDAFLERATARLANGCADRGGAQAAEPAGPATYFLANAAARAAGADDDGDAVWGLFDALSPHFTAFALLAPGTRPLAADWSTTLAALARSPGWWVQGSLRPLPCALAAAWDATSDAAPLGRPMIDGSLYALGSADFDEYRRLARRFYPPEQRRAWGPLATLGAYRAEPVNFHYSRHVDARFVVAAITAAHCVNEDAQEGDVALRLKYPGYPLIHFAGM